MKGFAPACERNKDAILGVLQEILPDDGLVLEIGCGTGQHAVYFARHLPGIEWVPSDREGMLDSIAAWRADEGSANLRVPIELDLFDERWAVDSADAVVCINVVHIVAWSATENMFAGAARTLDKGGMIYTYGPYRYADTPLEPSNENFDSWLRDRDPQSGIRDFEAMVALAARNGFELAGDRAMPANNRSLWWRRLE